MPNIIQNNDALANHSCLISGVFKACVSILVIGFVLAGCATLPTEYVSRFTCVEQIGSDFFL